MISNQKQSLYKIRCKKTQKITQYYGNEFGFQNIIELFFNVCHPFHNLRELVTARFQVNIELLVVENPK